MVSLVIYIKVSDGTRRPVYREEIQSKRVASLVSDFKEDLGAAYGGFMIRRKFEC